MSALIKARFANPELAFEDLLRSAARIIPLSKTMKEEVDHLRNWARDKAGRGVDFVLAHRRDAVGVVECQWNVSAFDATALQVFRSYYPKGRNYLVSPSGEPGYAKRFGAHEVRVCTPSELRA